MTGEYDRVPAGARTAAIFRWLLVLAAAAAAGGSLAFYVRSSGSAQRDATIYICPMHPQVRQDHPGECPICDMALVVPPKEEGAAPSMTSNVPGLEPLDLGADRAKLAGIETVAVTDLAIPVDALVDVGDAQYVFLARDGGRFEPRKVTVGDRSGGVVEIRDGLADGDVVVTTANFLIEAESRLRAALKGEAP
jgi:hypothetical protein